MIPADFTSTQTDDDQPGVRIALEAPLDLLLGALLAQDPGTSPILADTSLASVPGDDMFAALEAEMVSDALEAAQAQRRDEVRESVTRLLESQAGSGVDTVVDAETAQDLLEWLNRMYVTLRTRELAHEGQGLVVGEAQSPSMFLGLDEMAGDADDDPVGDGVAQLGLLTFVLALLVEGLQDALEEIPATPPS